MTTTYIVHARGGGPLSTARCGHPLGFEGDRAHVWETDRCLLAGVPKGRVRCEPCLVALEEPDDAPPPPRTITLQEQAWMARARQSEAEVDTLKSRIAELELGRVGLLYELEASKKQSASLAEKLTQETLRCRELTPLRARLQYYEHSRLGVRPEPLSLLIDDPSGDDIAPDATPEDRRRLQR